MTNLLQFAIKSARDTFTPENPHIGQMRRSILAAQVAQVFHYAAAELYGRETRHWDALNGPEKAVLIQLADDVLKDLGPSKCIYCGAVCDDNDTSPYCSTSCAVQAQREGA